MKTYCFLVMVMLATASVIFTACGNDDPVDNKEGNDEKEVTITPLRNSQEYFDNGITFLSEVGSRDVEFACSRDWKVTVANTVGGEYWCTISPKSGKTGDNNAFTVTTSENTGYDDRSVVLELEVGNIKKNIVITQKQKDAFLLTNDKFEVDMRGGKVDVEVKANIDYVYEIDELAKSWIKQSSKTRALTTRILSFDVSESEEAEKREGKIYFKSGSKIETVHIYQAGENILLLTEDEYPVSDRGEVIKVELKTNFDFEVQIPSVNWIHATDKTRAMSSHTLYYTIDANDTYDAREAVIVYSNKKKTVKNTLHIRQAQKDAIIISNKRYNVKGEGDAIAIKLNTNTQYQFTISDKSWIQQIKTRALVEETLYFLISKNDSELARTGTIIFKSGDISETITIVQDRKSVEELTLHIAKAGTLPELIPSDRKSEVRKLKLSGNLNGTDIKYLNEMASIVGVGGLSLDLSEANIVEGGLPYYDNYYNITNKIGDYSFSSCFRLNTILLPKSITEIGDHAFAGSPNLFSVTIPNGVKKIGAGTFTACGKLTSIIIPNSVTEIGEYAFNGSNLTSLTIPDSMAEIGKKAFTGCKSLASVSIPNSVVEIGEEAFFGCGFNSITIPNSVKKIGDSAFFSCSKLTSIIIPNSATEIGNGAFSYSGLTSINIPNSVKEFGKYIFSGCNSLASITISDGVTRIWDDAFYYCNGLTSIIIPNSVTEIGENAFYSCDNLTFITIPNSVKKIDNNAFRDCKSLMSITIPNSVTELGEWVFADCITLSSATISCSTIESFTFENCSNLSSVTILDSVKEIEGGAFSGCKKLVSIIIPNSVTDIGGSAFSNCSSLSSIVLSNNMVNIGFSIFENCNSLTSVIIPNSVRAIYDKAFSGCSSLVSITIPSSVTHWGEKVFLDCSNLTSVTISNGVTKIGDGAFNNCTNLTSIAIPNSVTGIGDSTFRGCTSLTSIYLPNSITTIDRFAFWGCSGLTSIVIPNSVKNIGSWAFKECSNLREIYSYMASPSWGSPFTDELRESCILYVPKGRVDVYRKNEEWNFMDIREMNE